MQRINLTSDVDLQAAEGEQSLARFEMLAYTGGPMTLEGFDKPVVVDLSGMSVRKPRRPVLLSHDSSQVVGHTETISKDNGVLVIAGVISGSGPAANEVRANAMNGFPWQASIGAKVIRKVELAAGKTATVNGQQITGPATIVRQSQFKEVSFVALGADDDTSARIAAKEVPTMFDQWLKANGFDAADLSDEQRKGLEKIHAEASAKVVNENETIAAKAESVDVAAQIREETAKALEFASTIRAKCVGHEDIAAKALRENWSLDRVDLEVLRASRAHAPAIHAKTDVPDDLGDVLKAAVCRKMGVSDQTRLKSYGEKAVEAADSKKFRGLGFGDICRYVAAARGKHISIGRLDYDDLQAISGADEVRASGGFSNVSLAGILGDSANKSLLDGYYSVPVTSDQFCASTDLNDFKTHTRYRMTAAGILEEVAADGELKHTSLSEESYTNSLKTYGKMITLTRQDMINDDLGAFLSLPRAMGRMAALAVEEKVFTLLLSNPSSFFSSGNSNLTTGGSSPLSITSLTTVEAKFMNQVDSAGYPVMITPKTLLVPPALKVTAESIYNEQYSALYTTAKEPIDNPHKGKFKPVASPWISNANISGYSTTQWYLFADPTDAAAMEIGYLRGNRTPTIESSETEFNVLGMSFRTYFDFGVAMRDHRAAQKSNGA